LKIELSNLETRRTPLFSARNPSQKPSRPIPTGVMGPRPVTTARLIGENSKSECRRNEIEDEAGLSNPNVEIRNKRRKIRNPQRISRRFSDF
jgi:hypothetical protein